MWPGLIEVLLADPAVVALAAGELRRHVFFRAEPPPTTEQEERPGDNHDGDFRKTDCPFIAERRTNSWRG
jgi:hypothetical protein